MTILFIGNHSIDFSTETHHRKTFEKLGHTVIQFQENNTSVEKILSYIDNADLLYWTHTHAWKIGSNDEVKMMLNKFKEKNIPTVGYHLDLWLGLEREKDLHTDPYWNIEYFFTVDKLMADWLNENTNTKSHYLQAGCFEDESYSATPDYIKYPHEIIFTGSLGYHHEYPYRPKLIQWLKDTYGNRFAHYGGGGLATKRGHELNVLYSSAKIVIGDTLCKDFTYPYYYSDRAFEVPCRNGFMIFPYIKGIEDCYEIGKEIVTYQYNDFGQLKFLIDFFLEHDEDRERIRNAGHQRAKKDHNYTVRLQQLLNTVFA